MEALNAQLMNYILIALILGFIVGTLFWWLTGRNKHVETHTTHGRQHAANQARR